MSIPFRLPAACLLSTALLAACGGGGKESGALAGVVDVVSVVASSGDQPIQAAPVSSGVLAPAVAAAAASSAADTVAVAASASAAASISTDGVVAVVSPITGVVSVGTPVSTPAGSNAVVVPVTPAVPAAVDPVVPVVPVAPVVPVVPSTPVVPTVTTTPTWIVCASENYVCSFSGTKTVRYGTSSRFVEAPATEQVLCGNATFGDPVSGQAKQCSVLVDIVTTSAARAPAQLGVYLGAETGGASSVDGYASWLGRRPDRALEFLSNESWQLMENASSRSPGIWHGTGLDMTFSVSMLPADHVSTLAAGARGDYDAHFATIAANFVSAGYANAVVRIGWEFNYGWYSWKASTSTQDFVTYWRRIVTAMRSVPGQNFRFDWCPAIGQGEIDTALAYPGDAYVDIIGLDVYNQTWISPTPTSDDLWQNFLTQPFGLQWHRNFGLTHGKPISYPEWGTGTRPDGHGMGDDPVFINHMADWITSNDVAYHDYWDYQAPDYDAKLSNGNFPQAGAAFRSAY